MKGQALTKDEVYAIEIAIAHFANDYIPRMAYATYRKWGRKEAIRFLRQELRWFGYAAPGKPYVGGTSKGVAFSWNTPIVGCRGDKVISFSKVLDHILAKKSKTLDSFF